MLCCDIRVTPAANATISASFHWQSGAMLGISGPSGVGKTTLLQHLAGLARPQRGRIRWRGNSWFDAQSGAWLAPHRRPVSLVFQDQRLFPHLDVAGNLRLAARFSGRGRAAEQDALITLLELRHLLHKPNGQLSGGQRSRVALARGLLAAPELILLDEPFSGLDHATRRRVMHATQDYLREHNIAAVLVSHDPDELASLCDDILPMADGETAPVQAAMDWLNQIEAPAGSAIAAVLPATCTHFSNIDGLACYDADGNEILVAADHAPHRPTARLSIAAQDVSLLLERPVATSIANCLPVSVAAWQPHDQGLLLTLSIGTLSLRCQITQRSFHRLNIENGKSLYAQFKANAVRVL